SLWTAPVGFQSVAINRYSPLTASEMNFNAAELNQGWNLKEICRIEDLKDAKSLTFELTRDGRRLLAVEYAPQSVLRVWDVSALHPVAQERMRKLSANERERLWERLFADSSDPEGPLRHFSSTASNPYAESLQAMYVMVKYGEAAVPWLRKRIG